MGVGSTAAVGIGSTVEVGVGTGAMVGVGCAVGAGVACIVGNGVGVAFAGDCSSLLSTSSGLLWTEVESPRPVFPTTLAVAVGFTRIVGVTRTVGADSGSGVSWSGQSGGSLAHRVGTGVSAPAGTMVGGGVESIPREHATMATATNRASAAPSVNLI